MKSGKLIYFSAFFASYFGLVAAILAKIAKIKFTKFGGIKKLLLAIIYITAATNLFYTIGEIVDCVAKKMNAKHHDTESESA